MKVLVLRKEKSNKAQKTLVVGETYLLMRRHFRNHGLAWVDILHDEQIIKLWSDQIEILS